MNFNNNSNNANNAPGQPQANMGQAIQLNQQQLQQLMMRFKSESELATRLGANSEEGRRHYATATKIKTLLINYTNKQKLKQQQQKLQQQQSQQVPQQGQTSATSPNINNAPNMNMNNMNAMNNPHVGQMNSSVNVGSPAHIPGNIPMGNMNMNNDNASRPASAMSMNSNQPSTNPNFNALRGMPNFGNMNLTQQSGANNNSSSSSTVNNDNSFNGQKFNPPGTSNANSPALSAVSNNSGNNFSNASNNGNAVNKPAANSNPGLASGNLNNTPLMIQVQNLKKLNYIYQEYGKKLANYRAFLRKPNLAPETIQKLQQEGAAIQSKLEQIKVLMLRLNQSLRQNRGNISTLAQQQQQQQQRQPQENQQNLQPQLLKPQQPQQSQVPNQPQVPNQAPIPSPNMNLLRNNMLANNTKNSVPATPSPLLNQAFLNNPPGGINNNNNIRNNFNVAANNPAQPATNFLGNISINQSMLNKLTPQQRAQLLQQYKKNQAMKAAATLSRANGPQMPNGIAANPAQLAAQQQMNKPGNIQNAMSPLPNSPGVVPAASPLNMGMNMNRMPGNMMGQSPVIPQTPPLNQQVQQNVQQKQQIHQQMLQQKPQQQPQPPPPAPPAQPQPQPQQVQQQMQPAPQQTRQPTPQNQRPGPPQSVKSGSQPPQPQAASEEGSAKKSVLPEVNNESSDLTRRLIEKNILKEPISSIPISKDFKYVDPEPVLLKDMKPSINSGYAAAPILSTPALVKIPELLIESGSGSQNRVVSKRKLNELVKAVGIDEGDGETTIGGDVEEILLNLADEFVNSVTTFACHLAKRRKVDAVDSKDIQLHLERNLNIKIPGYANDEIRNIRKWAPTSSYLQKINGVDVSRSVDRQTKNI